LNETILSVFFQDTPDLILFFYLHAALFLSQFPNIWYFFCVRSTEREGSSILEDIRQLFWGRGRQLLTAMDGLIDGDGA
jgi:hypothetical protein